MLSSLAPVAIRRHLILLLLLLLLQEREWGHLIWWNSTLFKDIQNRSLFDIQIFRLPSNTIRLCSRRFCDLPPSLGGETSSGSPNGTQDWRRDSPGLYRLAILSNSDWRGHQGAISSHREIGIWVYVNCVACTGHGVRFMIFQIGFIRNNLYLYTPISQWPALCYAQNLRPGFVYRPASGQRARYV